MPTYEGILLDEGGAVYNVAAYGVVTNDPLNAGAALESLLDQVPADATLLFPPGTYLLSPWSVYTLTRRLRLVAGGPGVVIQGPGVTYDFLQLKADVELVGLGFTNWRTVLSGRDSMLPESGTELRTLGEVRASRCRAEGIRYFVNWPLPTITPVPEGTAVERLVVEDCHFEGVTHAVVDATVAIDETVIRNNVVLDCSHYVCRLFKGEGEGGRGRLLFQGNYVRGLNQGAFTGDDAVARVVQASAERVEIINNFVRDVSTLGNTDPQAPQGGANFLYVTSSRLYVAGNLCWDVGSPGTSSAIIHEKNGAAFGAQIIGNTFVQSADVTATADAIQLAGDNALVDGVYASGLRGTVVATDRVQGAIIRNVSVKDHRGVMAILVLGSSDIHVDSPLIDGHVNAYSTGQPRGIVIQSRNDAEPASVPTRNDMSNIRITNPVIRDVSGPHASSGVGVHVWAFGGTIRGVTVHGGSITGCDRALELTESVRVLPAVSGVLEEMEILDTDLRGNRLAIYNNTAVDPDGPDEPQVNPPTPVIVRDCLGYRTENRGTATLLSAQTSVNVTHGLARVPALSGISVTPAGSLGNAARFWISQLSTPASYFTIHTDAAPGGPGVPFVWQATAEVP